MTRDVTAACPPPVVQIDRSFAAQPPRCVEIMSAFHFAPEATWIKALAEGTGEIKKLSECMGLTAEWIADERNARGTGQ